MAAKNDDRELVIERVFDAPRDLVFAAWTNPKHVASWWGPRGFTTSTFEMDVRKGGVWRFVMHGPDGTDYPNRIDFLEVVKNERLHYDHGHDDGKEPHFQATITFADEGAKTRVALRMVVASPREKDAFIKFGAVEGGQQTLERFGEQLQSMLPKRELVVSRVFDAPRALVFQAWSAPEHVKQWWAPREFTSTHFEMDFRPGGSYRHCMRARDGGDYWERGVYREIVENQRIVMSANLEFDPHHDMLVTVTFKDEGPKTRMTVRHSLIDVERTREADAGWNATLDNLAAYLAR